jgi:hypothetical protein
MMTTFLRWINGTFNCEICGETYHIGSFGTGSIICPRCYKGETEVIFLDETYWLNRLVKKLIKTEAKGLTIEKDLTLHPEPEKKTMTQVA